MIHISNVPMLRFNILYDNGNLFYYDSFKRYDVGSVFSIDFSNAFTSFYPLSALNPRLSYVALSKKKYNKFTWEIELNSTGIEDFFNKQESFVKDNLTIEDYIYITVGHEIGNREIPRFTLCPNKCCFEKKQQERNPYIAYLDHFNIVAGQNAQIQTNATTTTNGTNAGSWTQIRFTAT